MRCDPSGVSGAAVHPLLLDVRAGYLWLGWGWVDGVCPPTESMADRGDWVGAGEGTVPQGLLVDKAPASVDPRRVGAVGARGLLK